MIGRLFDFFAGRAELYTEAKYRDRLVSVITKENIKARISADKESGGVSVLLSPENAKKVAAALDKSNIMVYINNVYGLRAFLVSNCKRIGLLLGAIVFFTLLSLSTLFVFKVEVSGSELISVQTVKNELQDFGIRVGARLVSIDREAAANRFLQLHPELSWAAISFKGTTVRLEIKEKADAPPQTEQKTDFLIAECDGVVHSVLVYSGKNAVSAGAVVKKGDLLISGYISGNGLQYTDNPQLRYEGASGKVLATVRDSISVTVPFTEQTVSVKQTGHCGTVLKIFGKSVSFGKVSSESGYAVTPEKNLTLWGKIELPITYTECYIVGETVKIIERDQLLATELAKEKAYNELARRLTNAELTETKMTVVADQNGVTAKIDYVCVRNIAVPKTKE